MGCRCFCLVLCIFFFMLLLVEFMWMWHLKQKSRNNISKKTNKFSLCAYIIIGVITNSFYLMFIVFRCYLKRSIVCLSVRQIILAVALPLSAEAAADVFHTWVTSLMDKSIHFVLSHPQKWKNYHELLWKIWFNWSKNVSRNLLTFKA